MSDTAGLILYGVASRPLHAGGVSGDAQGVFTRPGSVLLAAIDGLGHGPDAAHAAQAAVAELRADPWQPLNVLIERCHRALRQTRGAAVSLASLDAATARLSWLAVGNVEAMLVRPAVAAREAVQIRGGIVGHRLPSLHATSLTLRPGDLLVFATDGIDPRFEQAVDPALPPDQLAADLLARYARGTDDALVLVARWNGRERAA